MTWLKNIIQGYLLQTFAIQSKKHPLASAETCGKSKQYYDQNIVYDIVYKQT